MAPTGSIHTGSSVIEGSVIESARALLIDPQDRVLLIKLAIGRTRSLPAAETQLTAVWHLIQAKGNPASSAPGISLGNRGLTAHRSRPSGKNIGNRKFKLGELIMSSTNQEIIGRTPMQDQSINHLIKWGDHLSVGHPEIDAQHKEIYEFGAEIYESWRDGVRLGELRISTDRLYTLLRAHFTYEERLLAKIGYGDLKLHAAEHRSMLKELQAMREHFKTLSDDDDSPGGSVLSPNWSVMQFILGFAFGHVMTSDMSYVQPLQASSSSQQQTSGSV